MLHLFGAVNTDLYIHIKHISIYLHDAHGSSQASAVLPDAHHVPHLTQTALQCV